ncbi:hypothetical protein [Haloarcula amylovorans]|uniref:hypothetical protein n=1 Tax=Haloarcula amylovorans TaxID=2562280 RepID=UPI001075E99C|nr:hypothetical protein [Halomicroarcula amylolytica]
MISRRAVLASGVGLCSSLSGCLTNLEIAKTGYLQFKIVEVEWRHDGERYRDNIFYAGYDGETKPDCRVAEEYQTIAASVADVQITDELIDRLESTFDDVRYVIGFCWANGECRNPTATREEFNRVQFGDRAEIVFDHPGLHIIDVYEDEQATLAGWDELNTVDFSSRHAEHGAPIA